MPNAAKRHMLRDAPAFHSLPGAHSTSSKENTKFSRLLYEGYLTGPLESPLECSRRVRGTREGGGTPGGSKRGGGTLRREQTRVRGDRQIDTSTRWPNRREFFSRECLDHPPVMLTPSSLTGIVNHSTRAIGLYVTPVEERGIVFAACVTSAARST